MVVVELLKRDIDWLVARIRADGPGIISDVTLDKCDLAEMQRKLTGEKKYMVESYEKKSKFSIVPYSEKCQCIKDFIPLMGGPFFVCNSCTQRTNEQIAQNAIPKYKIDRVRNMIQFSENHPFVELLTSPLTNGSIVIETMHSPALEAHLLKLYGPCDGLK